MCGVTASRSTPTSRSRTWIDHLQARTLTLITNVLLVATTGMASAHLIMPARPTTSWLARTTFAFVVIGSGALAGWRQRRVLVLDGEAPAQSSRSWITMGALFAVLCGGVAYMAVHG